MKKPKTTPWFLVGKEDPLPDRPGVYEVRMTYPGQPIVKMPWSGSGWLPEGDYKPNPAWGDQWRGVLQP
jgi:hypothetical protein